jgi:hypothetical protein
MEINHAPFLRQLYALTGACGSSDAAASAVAIKTIITG